VAWCEYTASKALGLRGMVQQGLSDGYGLLRHAQGRGTNWRSGGVDGRPGEGLHYFLASWRWLSGIVVEVTS
jgi:hypothetical protein